MKLVEFDKLKQEVWFDGQFIKCEEAKTHVLDHSIHFASAVFEGIRIYNSKPFKLTEHLNRFYNSAKLLDYEISYDLEILKNVCLELIKRSKIKNGYLRPLAWRKTGSMSPHALGIKISTIIAIWEWPVYYSEEAKNNGIALTLTKWKRPSNESAPTQSKCSGLYQICTIAKNEASRKGFDDALMLDYRNFIAETTSSNIFFVFNKEVVTPKPDCFLNGITRQTAIELCKSLNIKISERHMSFNEIKKASECFITGTAAEITPVRSIDKLIFELKDESITNLIRKKFNQIIIDN